MASQLLEWAAGAGVGPSVAVLGVTVSLLAYYVYLLAMPKPIAGIPYNKAASKKFLGDVAEIMSIEKAGGRVRDYFADQSRRHASPVVQLFMGPFSPPAVVVADYREAHDILVRRAKEHDRGAMNKEAWGGAVPGHFIALENRDPTINQSRELTKDLLTNTFLTNVSAPASYEKVFRFIDLWKFKAELAQGRPFKAIDDLNCLTADIIMAAGLGIENEESIMYQGLNQLRASPPSIPKGADNEVVDFPELEQNELLFSLHVMGETTGKSAVFFKPSIYWWWMRMSNSTYNKAVAIKDRQMQMHINRAVARLGVHAGDESDKHQPHAAVDFIVSREVALARKSGRAPDLTGQRVHDSLYTFLLGGQDTTHSTLSFGVKRLASHPQVQAKLRAALRDAHADAFAAGRQPTQAEITKTNVPYLDAFIEEMLRMDSPASGTFREATQDMNVMGHVVPKGSLLIFPFWGPSFQEQSLAVGSDFEKKRSESSRKHAKDEPTDWTASGFDGRDFEPERWLRPVDSDGGEVEYDSKAGPMMGFSAGTRACWGKRLAYLELRLVFTLLVWNFEFLPLAPEHDTWDCVDKLVAKPKSCLVRLKSI